MEEDRFLRKQSFLYRVLTHNGNPMSNLQNVQFLLNNSDILKVNTLKPELQSTREIDFHKHIVVQNGKKISRKTFKFKEESLVLDPYDNGRLYQVYLLRAENNF